MKEYKIYIGGTYRENWTSDYKMSVTYSERPYVTAVRENGRWTAKGGDEKLREMLSSDSCPAFERMYFEASAEAYEAMHECIGRGLPLEKLPEFFASEDNPLTAAELARILMDDCGFSLTEAYRTAALCCADVRGAGVDFGELLAVQPRTAHVMSLLRTASANTLAVYYDSRDASCRTPCGAAECGEKIKLSFRLLGGRVSCAVLVLCGDSLRREYQLTRDGQYWGCTFDAPGEAAALWYFFRIETGENTQWLCPDGSGFTGKLYGRECPGFRLTVAQKGFDTPQWFRKSVMYQIFPDRVAFSDDDTAKKGIEYHRAIGQSAELHDSLDSPVRWQARPFEKDYMPDDFYGGTFKGIENKLPYLKELGISCIYLNPIVEARSNHRYDASDYMRPDPILGTEADFESLAAHAAALGIRIILDGVFSHTGADSIYFNRYGHYDSVGACQGSDSPYYDWYDFKSFPDDYRSWWGFKELPEVCESNVKWQNYVISGKDSVVRTWLRRGAAGWRLDVADELPDDILSMIRDSAKAEKSDALILGEVWEDAVIKISYGSRRNYALGKSLDSVMNYPFRTAALDFANGRINAYELRDFLISQQMNYPKPIYYSLMNLLGSHDTDRVRYALAADTVIRSLSREEQLKLVFTQDALDRAIGKEKLCAVLQFSLPGVPSIYYGDEQGMGGVCDPFNRLPFKEGSQELHEYYVNLTRLRNSSDALSTGEAAYMTASADVLLILRYVNQNRDVFGLEAENGAYLIVINRSGETVPYEADCTPAGYGIVRGTAKPGVGEIVRLG